MDITQLNNITPFEVNTTILNSSTNMIPALVENTNTLSAGWFGFGIMLLLFISSLIILINKRDVFNIDLTRALAYSSGMALCVGLVGLGIDYFVSFQHVLWFGVLFALSIVLNYYASKA